MKKWIACFLIFLILPLSALGESLIRLHILAEDNSPRQQALKLAVRDQVLPLLAQAGCRAQTLDETFEALKFLLPQIRQAARRAGYEGAVRLETGWFYFDERELAGRFYPAGLYPACRILLGQGEGRNWWGLLNPDLTCACAGGDGPILWYLPQIFGLWFLF